MSEAKPPQALRDLDDRIVPRLQRATRTTLATLAAPALGLHEVEKRVAGGAPYRFAWHRRALVRTVAVVLALGGSAIHLQRYPDLVQQREAERAAAQQQTISRPDLGVQAALPEGAVVVGPPQGDDPEDYIKARTAALAELGAGSHVAMVSLSNYASAEAVLALLPANARVLSAQYRMPDARSTPLETEVVDGDLARSMERIIEDEVALLREEQEAQQELLDSGTIQSQEFERDARNRVEEIKAVRNVLAATGGIVFAVAVEADAALLRDLARDPAVRLVDVLPANADPATSILFGLKPDDRDRVTFGVPPRR